MCIVLDSSVLISAERAGQTPRKIIGDIIVKHGDIEAVLSLITVAELAHGIERAHSTERRLARERFLDQLLSEITVESITTAIAFRAGRLDGSLKAQGIHVALGDLFIGAAALELGTRYSPAMSATFGRFPALL